MNAEEVKLVAKLVERIDHLESSFGDCDCFECFSDRSANEKVLKKARKIAEVE